MVPPYFKNKVCIYTEDVSSLMYFVFLDSLTQSNVFSYWHSLKKLLKDDRSKVTAEFTPSSALCQVLLTILFQLIAIYISIVKNTLYIR